MIALAIVLFFIFFLRVRSYKECMSGASNSRSGGGFAGRAYSLDGFLDSQYDETHPFRRIEGPFTRCSPESHPYGCGTRTAGLVVMGRQHVLGIPTVN
jgi:hypothetical protein